MPTPLTLPLPLPPLVPTTQAPAPEQPAPSAPSAPPVRVDPPPPEARAEARAGAPALLAMDSPLGRLRLVADGGALIGVYLPAQPGPAPGEARELAPGAPVPEVLRRAAAQLAEYFAGARREFDVPLAPRGTAFQRLVWERLVRIPFGETRSYGELARELARPAGASRAVGAANGKNPISILVPCHRVIASSGELTGYAGGLDAKRWLLAHEARSAGR